MSDLNTLIAQGNALEKPGTEEQAIAHFVHLAAQYPDHAIVQYELGGAYDYAGQEAEAIPYYERAHALGLPDELKPRLALQWGSTLRNLARHEEAIAILKKACEDFPTHTALRAFYALALVSSGQAEKAVVVALEACLMTPESLDRYQRALGAYVAELRDQVEKS
jgi:tetratricopeptide (TPR) repeat protein